MPMMTRAALLRRLTPGAKLRLVYRSSDGIKDLPREVIRATAHSVHMKGPDYPSNRIHLANATIQATANGFELQWPEVPGQCARNVLRYEWVNPPFEQLEFMGRRKSLKLAQTTALALLASIRGAQ